MELLSSVEQERILGRWDWEHVYRRVMEDSCTRTRQHPWIYPEIYADKIMANIAIEGQLKEREHGNKAKGWFPTSTRCKEKHWASQNSSAT